MANKPSPRNWNDIQVVIATISMALTLVFWNLFAGPDRAVAMKRAQEQAGSVPAQPMQTQEPMVAPQSTGLQPSLDGKILLGGSAPQTQIIVQGHGGNGAAGSG